MNSDSLVILHLTFKEAASQSHGQMVMEMGSQEGSQETSSPERAMGLTAAEAQGLSFAATDTLGQEKGFLRSVGKMWSEELCTEQELNR